MSGWKPYDMMQKLSPTLRTCKQMPGIFGTVLTVICFFLFGTYAYAGGIVYTDGIAVKVNSDIITQSEIEDQLKRILRQKKISFDDKARIKEERTNLVKNMINEILIRGEGKKKGIIIEKNEVTKAIENTKKKNKLSDEVFAMMMKNQGITMEEYRKKIKQQLLSSRVVGQEVNSKIILNESDLREEYNKNKNDYRTEREVEVEHILLMVKPDAADYEVESARKKLEEIQEKIKQGASFEAMAKRYSEDPSKGENGSIGFIKRGTTVPQFEEVALKLPVGSVSDIVRTGFGFHLIKVVAEKERRQLSYEEAKEIVRKRLYKKKFNAFFAKWIKKVRKRSFVEVSSSLQKKIGELSGKELTFQAMGNFVEPIPRRERERIGLLNYEPAEIKRAIADAQREEEAGIKRAALKKVRLYKYLLEKKLITHDEYLKKINEIVIE